MLKFGLEAEISKTSMWRIVRNDLNMTPFKFRKRQLLNEATLANLNKETISAVCTQVPHRLEAVVKANGGHFE